VDPQGPQRLSTIPNPSLNPNKETVMKKLIAVVLLGRAGVQVAAATENNTYTDPYWAPRKFATAESTQFRADAGVRNYDQVDRFNP